VVWQEKNVQNFAFNSYFIQLYRRTTQATAFDSASLTVAMTMDMTMAKAIPAKYPANS